ncbi:hypothetical protein [Candidatus Galacturonibacter soehngenii]|uniref:GyrI-like small molecule binding domain-containing protein n=1 Tax=Candidatus Galacturonatibacter soehngenii TaxID=2307010 RepID=A0A7V7UCW7_9FIRM|nr:hypothetical protein [Candidatus Galacturonibacter soehngenii]KAB1439882.1 hypothetical protein F7O84_05725 [Candidatus Galacturonibacter soehngenii]
MSFKIISLPSFQAASSGVDTNFDFSSNGILGKFDSYFSSIEPSDRDNFMPRDFLFYDKRENGMVWWFALAEGMEDGGNQVVDFEGGLYLTYVYQDGDEEENNRLHTKALDYIEQSTIIELDERHNHYTMGHIITPKEVIKRQGFAQMETFIPIKLME